MPKRMKQYKLVLYRAHFCWSMFCTMLVTVVCSTGFILSGMIYRGTGNFRFWGKLWSRMIFIGAGFRISVSYAGSKPTGATHVFVSNHQNSLDIPLMLLAIPNQFGFVAKASLEKIPFLGWAITKSPSVFVDSRNPRRSRESIQVAAARIQNGDSVLVYPEGRRSWSASPAGFKRSAFNMAATASVDVVPIAIMNAHALFDERSYLSRPGRVHVVIGESLAPVGTSRDDVDELSKEARMAILSLISDYGKPTKSIVEHLGNNARFVASGPISTPKSSRK